VLKRSLTGVLLIVCVLLCTVEVAGEGRFYVTDNDAKVLEAPGGGWKVGEIGGCAPAHIFKGLGQEESDDPVGCRRLTMHRNVVWWARGC
jgi:hypothetical protein